MRAVVWMAAFGLVGCDEHGSPPVDAPPPPDAPCGFTMKATPAQVSFGSVITGGVSSQVTIMIANTGTCSTGPLAVTLIGSQSAEFGIANEMCAGHDLDPTSSCTFAVYFHPTSAGSKTAQLSVSARPQLAISLDGSAVLGLR